MKEMAKLLASLAVPIALSGILQITNVNSATSQEVSPKEIASLFHLAQRRACPEAINVDALTLESDFTVFMSGVCPQELQLKALRKLWTLLPPNPINENAI